ncbi:MAG: PAS domain-containing protein [Elainella sp. Prado103]|jgi:PAS domain S-box-containing protein|nr:PAS domain-containing protein [Elainella sp. Prado103]
MQDDLLPLSRAEAPVTPAADSLYSFFDPNWDFYRQQLAELELIYATAPIGLCFHDTQFRFIRINEQMAAFNGVSVAEHIGRTIYEVVPDFADYIVTILQTVLQSGQPLLNYEFRAQSPGCTEERDWLGSYYPVKDLSEQVIGINVMVQDITDRKRTEATLREQAQIIDQIHDSVIATDLQGCITSWNQGAVRLFGYQTEEAIGQPITLLYPTPAMQEALQQAIEPMLAQGEHETEIQMQRKSGEMMDALLSLSLVRDEQQKPIRMIGYSTDITARKQAEADLHCSQAIAKQQLAEIEAIYTTAPIGLCFLDPELRFVRVNQHLAEINGLAAAGHLGKKITDLFPDLADAQMPYFEEVLQSGLPIHNVELQGKTPAQPGRLRTWLVNYYPLKDASEQVLGINITVKEITERKRDEQLQQFLADVGSILTTTNDETAMLAGIAKLAVPILADCCFFDLLQDGGWQCVAWQHHDPQQAQSFAQIHQFSPHWWTDHPLRQWGSGEPLRITEQLDSWLDTLAIDPSHRQFLRELQLRSLVIAPLVVQERCLGLLTFGMTQASERCYTQVEQDLLSSLAEQTAMTLDNARLYRVSQQANRIKDEFLAVLSHELRSPLNPILGWSRLLQTRAFSPEKTQEALATIERNARLQAQLIEDLLDVSRILQGKLSLEIAPVHLVSVVAAAIETVRLAIEAKSLQLQLILIDPHQGKQTIDPFQVDLMQLQGFDQSLQFTTLGDASRLQQAIWNLLSNAAKFTHQGGEIKLVLEKLSIEWPSRSSSPIQHHPWQPPAPHPSNRPSNLEVNSPVELHSYRPPSLLARGRFSNRSDSSRLHQVEEMLQITVQDNGRGIPPEFLPYVFDYFRQADSTTTRQFGGLGLGLAIVRQVVELHGGTVQAESPGLDQGATFRLRLPLLRSPNTSIEAPFCRLDTINEAYPLVNHRILIVDDEVDSREYLAFVLAQAGAEVITVASAAETLEKLSQQPDLLISDIAMPETDGYQLLQQIRAQITAQQLPAIALTAYAGEYNAKQAIEAGFQHHLSKPVDPSHLIAVIIELQRRTAN